MPVHNHSNAGIQNKRNSVLLCQESGLPWKMEADHHFEGIHFRNVHFFNEYFISGVCGHIIIGPVIATSKGFVLKKENSELLKPDALQDIVNVLMSAMWSSRDDQNTHTGKIGPTITVEGTGERTALFSSASTFSVTFHSVKDLVHAMKNVATQLVCSVTFHELQTRVITQITDNLNELEDQGASIFRNYSLREMIDYIPFDLVSTDQEKFEMVSFVSCNLKLIYVATQLEGIYRLFGCGEKRKVCN